MDGTRENAVQELSTLQTQIAALDASPKKAAVQATFNRLIALLAESQALGALRAGHELPPAA